MNGFAIFVIVFFGVVLALLAAWGIWYLVWRDARFKASRDRLNDLHVFPHVDLDEYVGLWYEHYRINSWFEPADYKNVTAEYTLLEGNLIKVVNSAVDARGNAQQSVGTAAITDVDGVLDVSFFAPFSGLYVILGLRADENDEYTYAIVGSPSRDYLWLLGRSKTAPDPEVVQWLHSVAAKNGYESPELVAVTQE